MRMFEEVLGEIEERSRRFENASSPPVLSFIEPLAPGAEPSRLAVAGVAAAYRNMQLPKPAPAIDAPQIQYESFMTMVAEAKASRERLKALRRLIAWRLHPDRWPTDSAGATQSLAKLNAAIDSALRDGSG
jgi:hypothetical protein